ncbi:hypothetical protein Emag_003975 [Eimeria magna]
MARQVLNTRVLPTAFDCRLGRRPRLFFLMPDTLETTAMPPSPGSVVHVSFSASKKKRFNLPPSLISKKQQRPEQQLLQLLLLLLGGCVPSAASVQPSEAAEFEGARRETAPCDDYKPNHQTGSAEVSQEHALAIGLSQAPHANKSTQAAVSPFAWDDSTATAASTLAATTTAERYQDPPTTQAHGAWAGKTPRGKVKPVKCGVSNAATSVLLLFLLAASSLPSVKGPQTAEAKAPSADAAGGAAAIAAADAAASARAAGAARVPATRPNSSETIETAVSISLAESLDVTKAAELDAAAAVEAAAAEAKAAAAAAAVQWSVEATKADARWLARRLDTKKCDAAVEKVVKAVSEIWFSADEKLTPEVSEKEAASQRERAQQRRQQAKDKSTLHGTPESPFEGSVSPVEDLLEGINELLFETRAHLQAEFMAAYQERFSLTKAQMPLSALREDATVFPSASENPLEGHCLGAELASDALEKCVLKLSALGRELRLDVKRLGSAAASRPDLLLKRAIVAVKAADAIRAQSRRLLEEGLKWCDSGERAAFLFAHENLLSSKIDLFFLRQTVHLEMFDMKSFSSAASLAAHENLVLASSRMQQSSLFIQQIEAILNSTRRPFLSFDKMQTAGSLVSQLHAEVKSASNLLASARKCAKAEASAAETGGRKNTAATTVSLAPTSATGDRQEQQKRVSEEGKQEMEELRSILNSLVKDIIRSESRNLVFRLGTLPQGIKSSMLPFLPPSQKHFEMWKKARENAQLVLDQMGEAAKSISVQTTRLSLGDAISKLRKLDDAFRSHVRKGVAEFNLCKAWLQAETSLAGALEEYQSSLRTLASLQGKGGASLGEDPHSWKASVETAVERGVHETILMAHFISDETLKIKKAIAEIQAGSKRRDE